MAEPNSSTMGIKVLIPAQIFCSIKENNLYKKFTKGKYENLKVKHQGKKQNEISEKYEFFTYTTNVIDYLYQYSGNEEELAALLV